MAGVRYRVDSHIAFITFDDPERKNSLTPPLLRDTQQALERAIADTAVRAVLLTARGEVFCNGMDFGMMSASAASGSASSASAASGSAASTSSRGDAEAPDAPPATASRASVAAMRRAARQFTGFLTALHTAPKPVCAVVTGQVRAGGIGIVAAADIVLAAESARFELSELLFGLLPAAVMPFLLERIGVQSARYLCLAARNITAADALRIGLADQMTADDSIETACTALCRQLVRIDPRATPRLKRYTRVLSQTRRLARKTHRGQKLLAHLLHDRTTQRVIRGFTDEGRTPPWFTSYRPIQRNIV